MIGRKQVAALCEHVEDKLQESSQEIIQALTAKVDEVQQSMTHVAHRVQHLRTKYELLKVQHAEVIRAFTMLRSDIAFLCDSAPQDIPVVIDVKDVLNAVLDPEPWVSPHPSPSPSPSPSLILEEEEEEAPSVWDTDEEVVANIDWSDSYGEPVEQVAPKKPKAKRIE